MLNPVQGTSAFYKIWIQPEDFQKQDNLPFITSCNLMDPNQRTLFVHNALTNKADIGAAQSE
jgi:hypothetical protein